MSSYTPGPWEWERSGRFWGYIRPVNEEIPGPTAVAHVFQRGSLEEREANAALIAAAPNLLEALEECLPMLTGQHLRMVGHPLGEGTTERLHRIQSLINKAKGEEA